MRSDTITPDTDAAQVQDTELQAEDPGAQAHAADAPLVEEELLVEEVSIDGMCGVY